MSEAGEMAQSLRTLSARVDDLDSVPRIHMVAPNHPELQFHRIQSLLLT